MSKEQKHTLDFNEDEIKTLRHALEYYGDAMEEQVGKNKDAQKNMEASDAIYARLEQIGV